MANASRRSAPVRALQTLRSPRAYAVCAAVALLAGCGRVSALEPTSPHVTTFAGIVTVDPSPPVTHTPSAAVPADFEVQRRTWGGMCPGGPCETLLLVDARGTWVYRANGKSTKGTLTRAQVVALANAAAVTQLDKATGKPDCAANHDGTSVGYAWTFAGRHRSVTSCEHPINRIDDLVIEMDRVAKAIGH
ncbi:MAG TPA: hypothetical protein VFP73_12435 [Terrabacter sp.]|nr:hypothetical protein [Terrabacter sp.]